MHTSGQDVSINDYLTTFIKQFKYNFHAQLTMIQSAYTACEILQQRIHKAKESILKIQQCSFNIDALKQKVNTKTLQRFCLRLNEYVEYRVSKTKGLIQLSIFNELQAMCIALHRLFSHLSKQKSLEDGQPNLLVVFMRINQIETKYFVRVLRKMMQMLFTNKIHQNAYGLLNSFVDQKLKKTFENYMLKKNQNLNLTDTITVQPSVKDINLGKQKKYIFFQKNNQDQFISKLRQRKLIMERIDRTSSIYHRPTLKPSITDLHYYSTINTLSSDNILNPQDINQFSNVNQNHQSQILVRQKQNLINKKLPLAQDIMQINNQCSYVKNNFQNIMKQLIDSNKKNSVIIDKFRRKMNRKKSKLTIFIQQNESPIIDSQIKHKRSVTCDENIKKVCRQIQKALRLPQLKQKQIKI